MPDVRNSEWMVLDSREKLSSSQKKLVFRFRTEIAIARPSTALSLKLILPAFRFLGSFRHDPKNNILVRERLTSSLHLIWKVFGGISAQSLNAKIIKLACAEARKGGGGGILKNNLIASHPCDKQFYWYLNSNYPNRFGSASEIQTRQCQWLFSIGKLSFSPQPKRDFNPAISIW